MTRGKVIVALLMLLIGTILEAQVRVDISDERVLIDGQKYYIHTVEQGQTMYSICKAYNIGEQEVRNCNPEIAQKPLPMGFALRIPVRQEPVSDDIHYVVKPGDTPYSLCKKYNITVETFAAMNPEFAESKTLKIGMEVKFPASLIENRIEEKDTLNFIYHLVEKGETLYGLTRKFNVKRDAIATANPDISVTGLKVGNVIKIPRNTEIAIDEVHHILDSISFSDEADSGQPYNPNDSAMWFKSGRDFEIAILLPFNTASNINTLAYQERQKQDQTLSPVAEQVVSFYAGCLAAFDQLKHYNADINVRTFDIGNDNTVLSSLVENGSLENCDIIIGPAFRSQIDFLNNKMSSRKALMLIPFVDSDEILARYPQVVTLQPANDNIVDAVADFARLHPDNNYIIIEGSKEQEVNLANSYRHALAAVVGENVVKTIKFAGSLPSVTGFVSREHENIFILTVTDVMSCTKIFRQLFSTEDLNKLNRKTKTVDIAASLIGDPVILDYENIDYEYFKKIRFTYPTAVSVDYSNEAVRAMVDDFRATFLCEPDDNAFIAYDAVTYFGTNLIRHGNKLKKSIATDNEYHGLCGGMHFVSKPNYAKFSFSNAKVFMFSLQPDYSFVQVYPANGNDEDNP